MTVVGDPNNQLSLTLRLREAKLSSFSASTRRGRDESKCTFKEPSN